MITILIPAAGASTRMQGRDKLLEPVAGTMPLLAERVATARATGLPVHVALPPRDRAPQRWIHAREATRCVEITTANPGMGRTLAGLAKTLANDASGAMILPADMPDLSLSDLNKVIEAFDSKQVFHGANIEGTPGHPVIFPRDMFGKLAALSGDMGARQLLKKAQARLVVLPGEHALTDLDTPEDWAEWRQRGQAE